MEQQKKIILIAAFADQQVIGKDNQLLWHLSEDLKRFKRLTSGHAVIMGRKTHESIGRPLPDRQNIVLSREPHTDPVPDTVFWKTNWRDAVSCAHSSEIFVIGGAQIYELALPHADLLYLTRVHGHFEGDTFFPAWDSSLFDLIDREEHLAEQGKPAYAFENYVRKGV